MHRAFVIGCVLSTPPPHHLVSRGGIKNAFADVDIDAAGIGPADVGQNLSCAAFIELSETPALDLASSWGFGQLSLSQDRISLAKPCQIDVPSAEL